MSPVTESSAQAGLTAPNFEITAREATRRVVAATSQSRSWATRYVDLGYLEDRENVLTEWVREDLEAFVALGFGDSVGMSHSSHSDERILREADAVIYYQVRRYA